MTIKEALRRGVCNGARFRGYVIPGRELRMQVWGESDGSYFNIVFVCGFQHSGYVVVEKLEFVAFSGNFPHLKEGVVACLCYRTRDCG